MKLIVVKCPKNKKVQVEDRGTLGAVCPENCPMKQSSRCFNKTFRYIKPLPSSVVPDILYSGASGIQQAQHKTEKINITPPASPKVSESTRTETKKEPATLQRDRLHCSSFIYRNRYNTKSTAMAASTQTII